MLCVGTKILTLYYSIFFSSLIMQLQSERLIYTRYTLNDFEDYKRQAMDEHVMKFINGRACTEVEAKEKFAKIMTANSMHDILGYYSVKRKEDNQVIGLAKLLFYGAERGSNEGKENEQAEVGYMLEHKYWGNGYATEIAEYLSKFAASFPGIKEIIGIIAPDNAASKRVLTKLGYELYDSTPYNNVPSEWYKIKIEN